MDDNSRVDEVIAGFVQFELDPAYFHSQLSSSVEKCFGGRDALGQQADSTAHAACSLKPAAIGVAHGADGLLIVSQHRIRCVRSVMIVVARQTISGSEDIENRLVGALLK